MARLVALGDAHLGRTHLAHLHDEQGRNRREEDFLRSFSWAVDETIRQEPDGFVWLGDVFDHARPTYRTFAHVLAGLQKLADAGLRGVAISGNHDTPRVRGTGSPYDALERVFGNVTFAWRLEAVVAELAGVRVHAVPQTLGLDEFREQLDRAAAAAGGDLTDLLIAHVALSSLPSRDWRDMNELEIDESAFDRRFDLVVLGHYHVHQRASKRTWYAGSTDAFSFADRPSGAGPKGILVVETGAGSIEQIDNPLERPLITLSVAAAGLGPGELVDAVERSAKGTPGGAVVRVFLNDVDRAALRQVGSEPFLEAVPGALHVQIEADMGAESFAVQGGPEVRSLEQEWSDYVEHQDLAGLDRDRVVVTGRRFLEDAKGDVA
jgi:DNA repair exonuclease SbcCD nuclease subunit